VTRPILQETKIIRAAAVGACPPTAYGIRSALVWISEEDSKERGEKDVRDADDGCQEVELEWRLVALV